MELYSADLGIEMAYFSDDLAFGLPNGIAPEVTQMIDAGADLTAWFGDHDLPRKRRHLAVAA